MTKPLTPTDALSALARRFPSRLTDEERQRIEAANAKVRQRIWGRDLSDAETAEHLRAWLMGQRGGWPTDGTGSRQHARFIAHKRAHWTDGTEAAWVQFVRDYADALDRKANRVAMPVTVTTMAETFPCITCGSPVEREGNQCISCAIREAHTATVWDDEELCTECGQEPHEPASYLCDQCAEFARIQRVADE